MRKVTIFIPVYLVIALFCSNTQAQNTDLKWLKSLNQIDETRGFSKFITNTTTYTGFAVPITIGTVAIITHDDDLLKKGIYIGGSLLVDMAATYALKKIIDRPRPFITYPDDITPYMHLESASFPSGHASFAFATATSLSISFPKWYVIAPAYTWACAVGYSRMNLGVHYPSDILAGAVLGAGSAWVSWKVNQWFWKKKDNKKLLASLSNF